MRCASCARDTFRKYRDIKEKVPRGTFSTWKKFKTRGPREGRQVDSKENKSAEGASQLKPEEQVRVRQLAADHEVFSQLIERIQQLESALIDARFSLVALSPKDGTPIARQMDTAIERVNRALHYSQAQVGTEWAELLKDERILRHYRESVWVGQLARGNAAMTDTVVVLANRIEELEDLLLQSRLCGAQSRVLAMAEEQYAAWKNKRQQQTSEKEET